MLERYALKWKKLEGFRKEQKREAKEKKLDAKELHEKREFAKEAARFIQEEKEKGTIEKVKQKELKQL